MFATLRPLAEHGPVLVLVSREGNDDKLRVNITRKADAAEKSPPLSLSILATAEELDAELPLALAEGLAMGDAKPPTIAEQVTAQVTVAPEVVEMDGEQKPAAPARKARRATKSKRARAPADAAVITPLVKPGETAAPKRRRRKAAASSTPEGAQPVAPAQSAPAPEIGTGAGAAEPPPAHADKALPSGTAREGVPAGTEITGDGTGTPLPPIPPPVAPAAARSAENLDLFS